MRGKRGFPKGLMQKKVENSRGIMIKLTGNSGGQLQKNWYPQQGEYNFFLLLSTHFLFLFFLIFFFFFFLKSTIVISFSVFLIFDQSNRYVLLASNLVMFSHILSYVFFVLMWYMFLYLNTVYRILLCCYRPYFLQQHNKREKRKEKKVYNNMKIHFCGWPQGYVKTTITAIDFTWGRNILAAFLSFFLFLSICCST